MRDDESPFSSATPDLEPSGSWNSNGSAPTDTATADVADADADAEASAESATADDAAPDDDGAAFLADLARAMQTTAGAEHVRVSEDTERRRGAHLDLIRAREASGADALRELADDDVKGIDGWADSEIERIQRERERRILARRRDLEISLEDHRVLVAREVDAVEAAIVAYRAEVETYFSRLDAETDPVAIAQYAGSRPAFPVLDTIGPDDAHVGTAPAGDIAAGGGGDDATPVAVEETTAAADSSMIGVMDGDASTATADWPAEGSTPTGEGGEETTPEGDVPSGEPAEAPVEPTAVAPRSSAALLQAVPTLRPMGSWFRRGSSEGRSDTDA